MGEVVEGECRGGECWERDEFGELASGAIFSISKGSISAAGWKDSED